MGNGCEAYSTNVYIPEKLELTSHDPELTRHVFFLDFNEEYQNLTRYSMIEDLHFEQLTKEEKSNLPNRLTALPPLKFNHLKKKIKPPPCGKIPFQNSPKHRTNYITGCHSLGRPYFGIYCVESV